MRRLTFCLMLLTSVSLFAQGLGIISDNDLHKVGVKDKNIKEAKALIKEVELNYKMLILEKKQLELEVNKYIIDGSEKNLDKIDKNFTRIGEIETQILKDRIRSQITMSKFITKEQYEQAKEIAIDRINAERMQRLNKFTDENIEKNQNKN